MYSKLLELINQITDLEEKETELIKNYLSFWKNLNTYYTTLSNGLVNKGLGYQGLIYKKALWIIPPYFYSNSHKVFPDKRL